MTRARAPLAIAIVAMLAPARGVADDTPPDDAPPVAPADVPQPAPDAPAPAPPDDATMARIRALHERGDLAGVRRELLAAYDQTRHAPLLFALGQVELNLGNYAAAIDYYERFIATRPADDQITLAQQAIGAARMRMARPEPPPPPPPVPRRRRWYVSDTVLVALGGLAVGAGVGLVAYGSRLGDDRGGTLADYDARVDRARTLAWTGIGVASVGAVLAGVTVVRWRLRPDDGELRVAASSTGASVVVSGRW